MCQLPIFFQGYWWQDGRGTCYNTVRYSINYSRWVNLYQQSEKVKIGKIYKGIREAMGLSQEDVSAGLMSAKALSRFENDENYPNSYMMQILFERVGKSLRHFILMMSKVEYEYHLWRKDTVARIVRGDSVHRVIYQGKHIDKKLHWQFCTFWQGFLDNDLEQMQEAIACTVRNYPDQLTMKNCLSMEEINYILLFIEKKLTVYPDKWQEEYSQIQFLLNYVERMFDSEEIVEIYGRAVYVFGTYMDTPDINEKILLYKKAIELKRRNFKIEGLDRLLEGILLEFQKINQQAPENYEQMLYMLRKIKTEFHIDNDTFWQTKATYEVYLLDEVLQIYRQEKNKAIKEIVQKCCSEKTYRALENGMRDANEGTLTVLFDELEIKLGTYNADIITDNYADLLLVDKIKMVEKRAMQSDELQLLEHLAQTLGEKAGYIQNKQFIECIRDIALFFDDKITAEQYQERLEHTLSYTISECCIDNTKHFLTRVEMMLMYYTAILSRKSGNSDKSLEIINALWEQLAQSKVRLEDRGQETAVLMVLRKDLYTDAFRFDEALKIATRGIEYCFNSGDASKLYNFLFEIGWIYNELAQEKNKFMKSQCRKYFEYALCISEMFYIERNTSVIRKYLS